MDAHILETIPFQIDMEGLMSKLRLKQGGSHTEELARLVEDAQRIGRPKALYRLAFIDEKGEDYVITEGVRLRSHILRVNLDQAERIFPYVATCGVELEEWANRIEDLLHRYWAETIKETVMRFAYSAMEEHLINLYRPGNLSKMSPGSLADWPLLEQRPLFHVLGDTENTIGVRLTEGLLMIPTKSISGIRFPTEESFESCQLCPRGICPNRRSPFDSSLYDRKFARVLEKSLDSPVKSTQ